MDLTDLEGATVSLFLFGRAFAAFNNIEPGELVCVANPGRSQSRLLSLPFHVCVRC
jgi:hypothetical protein